MNASPATSSSESPLSRYVDPRPLAVARIGFGLLCLLKTVDLAVRLMRYADVNNRQYAEWLPDLFSPAAVPVLLALWFAAAVGLIIGFKSRVAALLLVGLVVYILLGDTRMFNQHFYLIAILATLFATSRCDAAYALDSRTKRTQTIPELPQFLMKVQLSVVYGYAFLTKLNIDFLSGLVIYQSAMRRPFAKMILPEALQVSPALNIGLAVFAVVTEAFLAFGLWVRWLRTTLLTVGCMFHLGMVLVMTQGSISSSARLFVFGALLLLLYPLFMAVQPESFVVLWSGDEDSPPFSVRLLRALNWYGALRFERREEQAGEGARLELQSAAGPSHHGAAAVARALMVCPLTCYGSAFFAVFAGVHSRLSTNAP